MPFELSTTQRSGYLHFRVSGENTPGNVRGYLAAIHRACEEKGCPNVLIEENLGGPSLPIGEIFRISSAGGAATAPAVRTIAYVDVNPEHKLSDMQFAENVAVTRGINIRVFASLPDAESWMAATLAQNSVDPSS